MPKTWDDVKGVYGLERLDVPGGWLYRTGPSYAPSMVFVPWPQGYGA